MFTFVRHYMNFIFKLLHTVSVLTKLFLLSIYIHVKKGLSQGIYDLLVIILMKFMVYSSKYACADPGIFVRGVQVSLTKKKL